MDTYELVFVGGWNTMDPCGNLQIHTDTYSLRTYKHPPNLRRFLSDFEAIFYWFVSDFHSAYAEIYM